MEKITEKKLTSEELAEFASRVVVQLTPGLTKQALSVVTELIDYRAKIDSDTLIELPCKVGDTIYTIQNAPIMHLEVVENIQIYSNKIKFITKDRFNGGFWFYYLEDFGEIAFTDKAEAEERLKELKATRTKN